MQNKTVESKRRLCEVSPGKAEAELLLTSFTSVKPPVEKSQTNATNVTMPFLRQAILLQL